MDIESISNARYEALSIKYLDENNINKGLYERDNIKDIIEEICDIKNIEPMYNVRTEDMDNATVQLVRNKVKEMVEYLESTGNWLLEITSLPSYPQNLKAEHVKRIGFDNE